MRISQAGLALITRAGPADDVEYLTQWNNAWQMYALVGGHVESGESFRQCCEREVAEELALTPDVDYRVAPAPLQPMREYTARSKSAGVQTLYRVELFATELLTEEACRKVNAAPENRWLTAVEIGTMVAADGKPISAQVETMLQLCRIIGGEVPT